MKLRPILPNTETDPSGGEVEPCLEVRCVGDGKRFGSKCHRMLNVPLAYLVDMRALEWWTVESDWVALTYENLPSKGQEIVLSGGEESVVSDGLVAVGVIRFACPKHAHKYVEEYEAELDAIAEAEENDVQIKLDFPVIQRPVR